MPYWEGGIAKTVKIIQNLIYNVFIYVAFVDKMVYFKRRQINYIQISFNLIKDKWSKP